jgi:hypothetical protein
VSGANDILAKLLSDDKKAELAEEVSLFYLSQGAMNLVVLSLMYSLKLKFM